MIRCAVRAPCAALAVLLAGCMLGPDYQRPAVDAPAQYRFDDPAALHGIADTAWWQSFGDSTLDALIAEALASSHDVRIAAARVDEFAGRLVSTRSALYPQVNANADAARQRVTSQSGPTSLPSGVNPVFNSYDALATAAWEIDLWGKIRRQTEAARADLFATEEARRGVVLSLVSSVALGYIRLRDLDRQLEIARGTLATRADSLTLFEKRFRGGVVSELELAQARSEYASALAAVPEIERLIAQTENALSILIGRNPGPIERGRELTAMMPPPVPAGLPSELLDRRPDLREAEQQLVSANAQIGAAKALYFPSISLTGALGTASVEFSNLFSGPARVWSYGAGLVMPIFNAGAIAGTVAQAEARERQAVENYRKSVQNAFADVSNALIERTKQNEQLAAKGLQVESLARYARLARLRYDAGYTSYLEVLDSERQLFAAELEQSQTLDLALAATVNLYKALGGGWVDVADRLTPAGEAASIENRARMQPLF